MARPAQWSGNEAFRAPSADEQANERTNVMFDESLSVNKSNCCFVLHELKMLARGARYARYFDL